MDLWICRAPPTWLCCSSFMVISEMFFQSLTNACHAQLESFQHIHRHGLPCCFHRHGHGSGQESCPEEEEHHWGVFNHQLCMGDAFGRNRRASCTWPFFGWSFAPWPRHQQLHSAVRSFTPPQDNCTSRSWVLGSCALLLAHLPLDSLWKERLKPLPFPCLSSKAPQQLTAHFTGVYFWTGSTNRAL